MDRDDIELILYNNKNENNKLKFYEKKISLNQMSEQCICSADEGEHLCDDVENKEHTGLDCDEELEKDFIGFGK